MRGRRRLDYAEPCDPGQRDEGDQREAAGQDQHPQLGGEQLAVADIDQTNARRRETGIERQCVHSPMSPIAAASGMRSAPRSWVAESATRRTSGASSFSSTGLPVSGETNLG